MIETIYMKIRLFIPLITIVFGGIVTTINAQEISSSFELRYFSSDTKANAITDFKGKTEFFSTKQRVDYLKAYEEHAQQFLYNPDWNKLVVSDKEAKGRVTKIKQHPLPNVRNRMLLQEWKSLGSKNVDIVYGPNDQYQYVS